jgi:hypothetical protein
MFENLSRKKIRQNFFSLKVTHYLMNLHFSEIADVIDNALESLVYIPGESTQPNIDGIVRVYKENELYVIYCDRVRIIVNNGREKLVKVSILGQNDMWKVWELDSKGKNITSIDSPETNAYTVYTYCDIMMPTGKMMCDERYTKGTWNEYVYETVKKIVDYIMSFKERNKFNNYYNF